MGKQVGILLISTRAYKKFVQPLVHQIDKYFLPIEDKVIFVFTDQYQSELESENSIIQILIPDYKYPYASLFRYKIFIENEAELKRCSHLVYLDVDMAIENIVSEDILCDGLTMTYHPGFYTKREEVGQWGSNGVVKESLAWIEPEKRFGYVAGGFNAGRTEEFLEMAKVLSKNIEDDSRRGVMAEYHDESHMNAYIKNVYNGTVLYLTPSYCLVQQKHLREAWGISGLKPVIVALSKNHSEIRS